MVDPLYFLFMALFLLFLSHDSLFWAALTIGMGCLQHKVNEFLDELKGGREVPTDLFADPPQHVNFI
jgi:hypothetical protein